MNQAIVTTDLNGIQTTILSSNHQISSPFLIRKFRFGNDKFLYVENLSYLYTGMDFPLKEPELNGEPLSKSEFGMTRLKITGLNKYKKIPPNFGTTIDDGVYNFHCILSITINNLMAETAEIIWKDVSSKKEYESSELRPIIFESEQSLRQTKANILIGSYIVNKNYAPNSKSKKEYLIQRVNTDLMMCNMVFNGSPVLYPTPFYGTRSIFVES